MPKTGFKSITIHTETYDKFESMYNELKELGRIPPGIQSFTGYVTYRIENHINEKESLSKLASQIITFSVPANFTDNKIIIKVL